MVDESNRIASGRDKARKMTTSTASTTGATVNTNTDTKQRRRRSIFSVLFNQSKSNKSVEEQHVHKNNKSNSNNNNNNNNNELTTSLKSEISKSDIVLIRPNEAKCIEATIRGSVIEADDANSYTCNNNNNNTNGKRPIPLSKSSSENAKTKSISRNSQSYNNSYQQQHSIKLMKRKIKGKMKRRDEDADSYVLDLNDRLETEKLRISSSSSSASSLSSPSPSSSFSSSSPPTSSDARGNIDKGYYQLKSSSTIEEDIKVADGDKQREDSAGRETSPIDDLWRTNENYVPCAKTNEVTAGGHPPAAAKLAPPNSLSPPPAAGKQTVKGRRMSPMLEEFLKLHQIQLSDNHHHHHRRRHQRRPGLNSNLNSSSEIDIDNCSSSSCDSLSCCRSASSQLPPAIYRQSELIDRLGPIGTSPVSDNTATSRYGGGGEIMSESDRRLYHWRKLAERSVTMWQVPAESSTEDSDDELELVSCQSPALVCYCSDDTSCSSVELIWSRPQLQARQQQQQQRQQHQYQQERQRTSRELRDSTSGRQFVETFVVHQKRQAELRQRVPPNFNNNNNSAVLRLSNSVSPARSKLSEDSSSSKASPSPVSGGGLGGDASRSHPIVTSKPTMQNLMLPTTQVSANSHLYDNHHNSHSNSNYSSLVSDSGSTRSSWRQKPAILELAKPYRARGRRIGERKRTDSAVVESRPDRSANGRAGSVLGADLAAATGGANQARLAPLVPPKPKHWQRNSMDCSTLASECSTQADQSKASTPTSFSSHWVANPLFGRSSRLGYRSAKETPAIDDKATQMVAGSGASGSGTSIKNRDKIKVGAKSMDSTGRPLSLASSQPPLLRRGLSVDLLNQQPAATSGGGQENDIGAPKSSRFRDFLARLKKLDPSGSTNQLSASSSSSSTSDNSTGGAKADLIANDDNANNESLDNFSLNESSSGFDANERHKRHRWSLRMRSPFTGGGGGGSGADTATRPSDHSAYLGRHLINLDRRFKSNVSSLRSHLSDTGKRASVLADQLLTSIKDTTKEQLLAAATGTSAHDRDRYDTLPNSFATQPQTTTTTTGPGVAIDPGSTPYDTGTNRSSSSKAKQFALIYMHQQAQATGQPVITRQPLSTSSGSVHPTLACNRRRSIGGGPAPTRTEPRRPSISSSTQTIADRRPPAELAAAINKPKSDEKQLREQQQAEISMEQIMEECMKRSCQEADKENSEPVASGSNAISDCSEAKTADLLAKTLVVSGKQVRLVDSENNCTTSNRNNSVAPSASIGLSASGQPTDAVEYCQTIGSGVRGREVELRTRGAKPLVVKKRLRPKSARRQINVPLASDDEDGDDDANQADRKANDRASDRTASEVSRLKPNPNPLSTRQYFKTRSRLGSGAAGYRQNVTY